MNATSENGATSDRRTRGRGSQDAGGAADAEKRYIAFCDYFATGEGRTVMVAVGCSPFHAEQVFKQSAHSYFHAGMVVAELGSPEPETRRMAMMIPDPVLRTFQRKPSGTPQFYCELHFNMA
ncbi:hypothetical protein [Lysobacter sp. GCM10012299]|uniref:hypothetical protein n=1 Tax=Lysobacter sp. GCM10012299 TaxID=3317333 RepID=UPI00360C5B13